VTNEKRHHQDPRLSARLTLDARVAAEKQGSFFFTTHDMLQCQVLDRCVGELTTQTPGLKFLVKEV
jgi:hypothetical protein